MSTFRTATLLFFAVASAGCASRDTASASDSAIGAPNTGGVAYAYERVALDTTRTLGAIIDSVFPMPEMLRRFRAGLPAIASLRNGAPSKQNLVAQFITALAASDRATLSRLTLSRAEYAYVFFPNTPDVSRENGLTPQLGWDQVTLASEKGIGRALSRIGGKPATLNGILCADGPRKSGEMTLHPGCTVRLTFRDGTTFDGHLFGSIVEYAGRFKFVGYANDM
jgi:hypothetical protein